MSRYNCPHYFLLGSTPTEDDLSITGAKLPTVRQVLMCFLASHASPMTVRAAAKATVVKVLPFYDKARIPTLNPVKMEEEVLKLHTEMKNLLKIDHQHRETEKNKTKFNDFKQKLEKTMKFWPRDALERIKTEEDKKFLHSMMTDRVANMGRVYADDSGICISSNSVGILYGDV